MKGILGRKAGMTSVFTEHGRNIPVSIIEIQPNVVTGVFTKDNQGYTALQLAAFDRRSKTVSKPVLGHLSKAKAKAKRFIREIRDMEGFKLGQNIDASIFSPGEFVDVTGTSKGKGFQGNIKRHNQKIGPKSHGGGGGSKPTRQTGSIGDVVSNKVNKGMTMPGHMGAHQVTVQNLEIVSVDQNHNFILVKGSIPGPNKGFVIVKENIKGLDNKEAIKLVDLQEAATKNALLEEAKKVGADVNTDMSVADMQAIVTAAQKAKKAQDHVQETVVSTSKQETAQAADHKDKASEVANEAVDTAVTATVATPKTVIKATTEKASTKQEVATKADETPVVVTKATTEKASTKQEVATKADDQNKADDNKKNNQEGGE